MLIRELFENRNLDKHEQFVTKEGDKKSINYDLVEDLAFFMNEDDETYRRHLFSPLSHCLDRLKANKPVKPSIFADAVKEGYKSYVKKFNIRELPDELEDKIIAEACKKMYEDLKQHYDDGKYKD